MPTHGERPPQDERNTLDLAPLFAAASAGRSTAVSAAWEIMWVRITAAEGVYGEGGDVPDTVSGAVDEGRTDTFERLHADGDGQPPSAGIDLRNGDDEIPKGVFPPVVIYRLIAP